MSEAKVFKLKDFEQLPVNRIYRFDNLSVVWDGSMLLSKYPQEIMWHPWDTKDEWFEKWKERELTDTGRSL